MEGHEEAVSGLNILFQGLVRCFPEAYSYRNRELLRWFNDRHIDKALWQSELSDALTEKLKKYEVTEDREIFYRHYIMCLIQIYLSRSRSSQLFKYDPGNFDSESDGQISNEKARRFYEHFEKRALARTLALIKVAMEYRGIDEELSEEIAKELEGECQSVYFESWYLIDLPLNDYLFNNMSCALQLLSTCVSEGLINASKIRPREPLAKEPLFVLVLNKEINSIIKNAIKETYIIKSERKNGGSFEFYKNDLKIRTIRDMASEILEPDFDPKTLIRIFDMESFDPGKESIIKMLRYATSDVKTNVFKEGEKPINFQGIVSKLTAQFASVGEVIYEGFEWRSRTRGENSRSFQYKDTESISEIISHVVERDYGIHINSTTINDHLKDYAEGYFFPVISNWDKTLEYKSVLNHADWLFTQLLVGNLDYIDITHSSDLTFDSNGVKVDVSR